MFKAFRSRVVVLSGTLAMLLAFLTSLSVGATAVASSAVHSSTSRKAFTPAPSNTAVLTYKNDTSHSGWNSHETILTPQNVNSQSFGLHGIFNVDGQVYAQPLYVPNLNGHNVVFVATEHDSLYALDADGGGFIWKKNFLINGAVSVTNTDVSCNDMVPFIGITSTPVVDLTTNTIYLTVFTKENGNLVYRLHALDLTTGNEKFGGPKVLSASGFNTHFERQRANLLLSQGNIYIAFSSFCDNIPYHGFILSYSASTLAQVAVYNDTPNGSDGGIWGAAGTMTADASGNIYVSVGNGTFDLNSGGHDAGDSLLKLSPSLKVLDYFTPFNQSCLSAADADLGSGGVLILPNHTELMEAGKQGRIYVANTSSMGHYRVVSNACNVQSQLLDTNVKQELSPGIGGVYSTPTTWNGTSGEYVYVGSADHSLRAFQVNADGTLVTTPSSKSVANFVWPGANPVVSSNGGSAGIVWAVDSTGVLHAYDASNLANELYNTAQKSARDGMDNFQKFAAPTVANGEVFVGTQDRLYIYGELLGGYNNIGISNDTNTSSASFDLSGDSYSFQALQAKNVNPGSVISFNGVSFIWPAVTAGTQDDYDSLGETIIPVGLPSNATTLAFLGTAINGNASTQGTITFTDGTTQTFTLSFTDWTRGGGKNPVAYGNGVVITTPYRNTPTGKQTENTYVYYTAVSLTSGKTVKSVTLPSNIQLHVFAIGGK